LREVAHFAMLAGCRWQWDHADSGLPRSERVPVAGLKQGSERRMAARAPEGLAHIRGFETSTVGGSEGAASLYATAVLDKRPSDTPILALTLALAAAPLARAGPKRYHDT